MTKKVLVHLPCAFEPEWVRGKPDLMEKRTKEFVEGFKSLWEVLGPVMTDRYQVQVFDNTLTTVDDIPFAIRETFPSWVKVHVEPFMNRFGWKNKGAGTIEGWSWSMEQVLLSDWFVHHEPRTLVEDPTFLRECLTLGPTRFADRGDHFYTGTLAMRSWHVAKFVEGIDLWDMVSREVGIEYNLREFVLQNVPPKSLHLYPSAGIRWHDSQGNKTENM